jgi:hypothetical protein
MQNFILISYVDSTRMECKRDLRPMGSRWERRHLGKPMKVCDFTHFCLTGSHPVYRKPKGAKLGEKCLKTNANSISNICRGINRLIVTSQHLPMGPPLLSTMMLVESQWVLPPPCTAAAASIDEKILRHREMAHCDGYLNLRASVPST